MTSRWRRFRESKFGRFLRRYWWAYPAFLALKWGAIGVLGYTAASFTREGRMKDQTPTPSAARAAERPALNLKAGDRLPAFELPCWRPGSAQPDRFRSLELAGKQPLLLFFYPLDDTPG